jgi:DNA-directed RNA polymerase subunit M/transcription elongation factor TFIIS
MHFCSECHNMYYLKVTAEDANSLVYYCRNCGHTDNAPTTETICVSTTQFKKNDQKFTHIINEYTKFDPTLPRINTIKCPNNDCSSNKDGAEESREVIYIRYDDINMKYIYLCTHCDKMWKTIDYK